MSLGEIEMKEILHKLVRRQDLTTDEATAVFDAMMNGSLEPTVVAGMLIAIATKGASVDEIVAAARAMRSRSNRITIPDAKQALDTCGTGGDVKGTFNVSTAAAIVVASCGVRVVKHGNRSASSRSGSADVLETLGVKIDLDAAGISRCIDAANVCFAFARSFHPAMKHVAPIRAALGVPTIFNVLGPLTNPAGAGRQLLGVFSPAVGELLAEALLRLGTERAWVVHGHDGLDEISTMSPTTIWDVRDGQVTRRMIDVADLGVARGHLDDLVVRSPAESAEVIRSVLSGEASPAADLVAVNAAAALAVARDLELGEALHTVRARLEAGDAIRTLESLIRASNG